MNLNASKPKFRRAAILLSIIAVAWLIFSVLRARRLLQNAQQIAAQSQSFKRDYFVGNSNATPLLYVAMGDSTAAGFGAARLEDTVSFFVAREIAARGYRVRVINLAQGGARFGDVARLQLPQLQTLRPDIITLSIGANDATHFTPDAQIAPTMQLVVAALARSNARTVLIANTPDMALAPALPLPLSWAVGAKARRLNAIWNPVLSAETARNPRLQPVDLFKYGKLNFQVNPALYAADLFHPSARGYGVWAKIFARNLDKSLDKFLINSANENGGF